MKHARLSASSAERWMACAASVSLSSGVPRKSSIYASYGTVLHDIAAFCLNTGKPVGEILTHTEDREPVQIYLDEVRSEEKQGQGKTYVEVTFKELRKLDVDLGGTADYVRWRESIGELLVMDFKTGSGVDVEAEGNKQLMIYALGALLELKVPARTVRIKIVQPRLANAAHHIKEWKFKAVDLLEFAADVRQAAVATRDSDPVVTPGEVQCKWCPAGEAGLCEQRVKYKPRKNVAPAAVAADFPL